MSRPEPPKQETWYCAHCGSLDIRHDAIAQWNAEREDWDVIAVLDGAWCETCMDADPNKEDEGAPSYGVPDETEVTDGP